MARHRLLVTALAILLALGVVAYALVPTLLARAVTTRLAQEGIAVSRLDIGFPGPRGVTLHAVELAGERAGFDFRLQARDVALTYSLGEVRKGRLRTVRVAQASLHAKPAPSSASASAATVVLPDPAAWHAALPLQALTIDGLDIEWRGANRDPINARVRGAAQRTDAMWQSRWTIADGQDRRIDLELSLNAAGAIETAVFSPAAKKEVVARFGVQRDAKVTERVALAGTAEAHLAPLVSMAKLWVDLPAWLAKIDGRVTVRWDALGPAMQGTESKGEMLQASLGVELSGFSLGEAVEDGELRLDMKLAGAGERWRYRVSDSLRVAAFVQPGWLALTDRAARRQYPRAAKPLVLRAPQGLSGEVAYTAETLAMTISPKAEIVLEQLRTPDVVVPSTTLILPAGLGVHYLAAPQQWRIRQTALWVKTPTVQPQFEALGPIEKLSMNARIGTGLLLPPPAVTVDNIRMNFLGGRWWVPPFTYDVARDKNHFTIELEAVDLGRLVALERQQGVEASGALDGRLPVSLGASGITITHGSVHARAPGGTLRYQPNDAAQALAQSNPSIELLLKALSNYHYEKLEVDVNYSPSGDLDLAVAMAGMNPDWNAGQPVNLKVNVSDNIPMLLRSLRLADDISEEVGRRVLEREKTKR
ncbi:MAG: YdbH domain-containing protein [Pseudomonadota bacterium]|nr:MAG: YdbH domain-containing protein [Pseudomonadota bacterium]